jgi:hypothetical protein
LVELKNEFERFALVMVAPVKLADVIITFDTVAFVRLAFVRLADVMVELGSTAPDKSIPVIFTLVRVDEDNAAPDALTPAPIIYPFRATYPVGNVAVVRFVIPPD